MLWPADQALVERDPSVPGLALLLDPDALTTVLRRALPEVDLRTVRITYLRYKAATSCLAACKFRVGDEEVDAFVHAYGPSANDKLGNARRKPGVDGALGPGRFVLDEEAIVVSVFPNDSDIKELTKLADADRRRELFRELLPGRDDLDGNVLERLAYKPKRRYVGAVLTPMGPELVVRAYAHPGYESAAARRLMFTPGSTLSVARRLAAEPRRGILIFEWLPGTLLTDTEGSEQERERLFRRVGFALAELHSRPPNESSVPGLASGADLPMAAATIATICPPLAARATDAARRVAALVDSTPLAAHTIHGDFHPAQTLIQSERVGVLDFDRAGLGHPAYDLGTFIAHLERDGVTGRLGKETVERFGAALLEGYAAGAPAPSSTSISHHTAAALLRLAPDPFRYRDPDWPRTTAALVDRAADLLASSPSRAVPPSQSRPSAVVDDPYGVAGDQAMPFLEQALDPIKVQGEFESALRRLTQGGRIEVRAIRVTRYKPARRCVIEYDLDIQQPGRAAEPLTLVGKARARGLDTKTFACLQALWRNGFDADSEDGISVPEPVGLVPALQIWLQRKVPGTLATRLLPGPNGVILARRITDAIDKLHRLGPKSARQHTMADELGMLRTRITAVVRLHPMLAPRLVRLLDSCERLGAAMSDLRWVGVHRDFYPDQVIVDGRRLYLLDLDLYAEGDPALDVGNFIAHLMEQGLRMHGDAGALSTQISAMEERFAMLSGNAARVRLYAALTLARHISISTQFPDRQWTTPALLELAERHLDSLALRSVSAPAAMGEAE